MKLPEFVFLGGKQIKSPEFILSTEHPYSLFRAYKFDSSRDMDNFVTKHNIYSHCAPVPGYNILICYVGTLDNLHEKPVLGHLVPSDIVDKFPTLIDFYETERIKGNESRIKKHIRR